MISFEFKTNVKIRIPPPSLFLNCTFIVLKPHSFPQDFFKYMNIMFRIRLLKTWHSLRSRTHFWNGRKMHNREIFFCSWRWSRQTRSLMPCQLRIRKWSLKLVSEPDPGASLLAEIAKFVHVIMFKRSLSFYFFLFFNIINFIAFDILKKDK